MVQDASLLGKAQAGRGQHAASPAVACGQMPRATCARPQQGGGGRDLSRGEGLARQPLRVNHFVGDLNVVYPAPRAWQEQLTGAPIPFGAVRTLARRCRYPAATL